MYTTWHKLAESSYRAGYRRMLKKTFRLPDGTVADYDIKDEGRPVCVLAFTPAQEEVVTMPLPEFRVYLRRGRLANVDCAYMGLEFLRLL
jgi:hypothetical protein